MREGTSRKRHEHRIVPNLALFRGADNSIHEADIVEEFMAPAAGNRPLITLVSSIMNIASCEGEVSCRKALSGASHRFASGHIEDHVVWQAQDYLCAGGRERRKQRGWRRICDATFIFEL